MLAVARPTTSYLIISTDIKFLGGQGETTYAHNNIAPVDLELSIWVRDSDAVHDNGEIIRGETISAPLRKQSQCNQQHKTITIPTSSEEVQVTARPLYMGLETESVADFKELELHGRIHLVPVGMVLGQDGECLPLTIVVDQPTRRFGDPPEERNEKQRGDGLEE
jgi:hypothetical protein